MTRHNTNFNVSFFESYKAQYKHLNAGHLQKEQLTNSQEDFTVNHAGLLVGSTLILTLTRSRLKFAGSVLN